MITFCFNEMMSRLVAEALRTRGYEIVMTRDAGMIYNDDNQERLKMR